MHGVKKSDLTKEKLDKIQKNVDKYKKLNESVLQNKKNGIYSDETFNLCDKILTINSEHYTVWNYRREHLLAFFKLKPNDKKSLLNNELKIIYDALKRNPKSYCAFHHRMWCVNNDDNGYINIENELLLCTQFLKMDSRNFHCWDYRRFIVNKGNISLKDELKYTTDLIERNFSNYSAWHYRSTLLPQIYKDNKKFIKKIKSELKWVQNAFYTEPDDQSGWLYHRWLLGKDGIAFTSNNNSDKGKHELPIDMLLKEYQRCIDVLNEAPNAKWAMLTKAVLIRQLKKRGKPVDNGWNICNDIFVKLIELDPDRKGYYIDVKDDVLKQLK